MNAEAHDKKPQVLIVDDEKTAHQLYKLMLKSEGYRLFHAESGKEAVEAFNQHPDISIILMDIKMPDMNGYEATMEIRRKSKDVIIIAQTAYALPADKKKAYDAGCNDHLTKPVDRQLLLNKINEHLGNKDS